MRSQRSVKDTDRENYAPFEFTVLAIRAIDRTKLAEPGDLNLGVKIHPYISKPPFLLFLSLSCSPSPSISRIPSACRWFVTRRAITISSRGTRETWRNKFQREPSSVSVERERERERESPLLPLDLADGFHANKKSSNFVPKESRIEANSQPRRRIPLRHETFRGGQEIKLTSTSRKISPLGDFYGYEPLQFRIKKHFPIC